MKRNERITSSWGFLAQGTKAALCLLVLMLSVQTVFAQKGKYQFVYKGFTYLCNGDGSVAFTGNKFKEAGRNDKEKYDKDNPYPEVIVVPDFAYDERTKQTYPVTSVADGACEGDPQAYCDTKKIIIGDNVVQIGKNSFKSFGKRDKTKGSREIILGKNVTQIGDNSFAEFGKGNLKDQNQNQDQFKVYIQTVYKPYCKIEGKKLKANPFREVRGVTFYVKNEEVYQTFMTTDKDELKEDSWPTFDVSDRRNQNEGRRNMYNYDGFEIVSLKAGQWQTAVFPEYMNSSQVQCNFGQGTLLAVMSTNQPETLKEENMNYLVTFIPTDVVNSKIPMLIKPGSMKDVYYISETSYGIKKYTCNPVVSALDKYNNMTIRMIGICDDDHLLTDGQIYFRNYGDGNMRFFMYKEGDGAPVMVKRGKCIWEIVDGCGNVLTNKALDYKIDDAATAIEDVTRKPAAQDGRIYSLTGQYEGTSLENLPKGIHIMNGRKFVVK